MTYVDLNHNSKSDRWNKLNLSLKPWKSTGDYILVCLQNPMSTACLPKEGLNEWILYIVHSIRKYSNRKIIIRPHPRSSESISLPELKNVELIYPIRPIRKLFNYYLENSWALVNFNSNPAIEAAIKGIPIFTDNSSLASPVANLSFDLIETPKKPDRTQWAYDLAYTEWNINEIKSGIVWRRFRKYIYG